MQFNNQETSHKVDDILTYSISKGDEKEDSHETTIDNTNTTQSYVQKIPETDVNATILQDKQQSISSQKSLALQVLQGNTITLVPTMGAFMVQGSKGSKYAVTLFSQGKLSMSFYWRMLSHNCC